MSIIHRNIVITPNRGQAAEPNIRFVGADASSSATITLRVYNTGTVGSLSFEGDAGQLFSMTDSFTGTIFSVNDVSGIPSIEVFDTGEVRMAQFGGFVNIPRPTGSSSTNTGALRILGGVGIGGGVFVGGVITATSFVGNLTGTVSTATNLAGGTAGQVPYQTGAGATTFFGPGSVGQLLVSAGTAAPTYTSTGSIYVAFANSSNNIRAGTAGQIPYQSAANTTAFVGPGSVGQLLVSAGTAAPTYTSTGSIYVNRAVLADNDSGGAAGGLRYQTGANASTFLTIGTAGQMLRVNAGATAPEWVGTASVYVNNAVNADTLRGGTAGQLVYQSAVGTTAFAGPGTAGQLLVSAGTAAPTYTNTGSIYVGFATGSNNIRAGTAGQLVYQSAANTTAFVGPGTAGQILVSAGTSAPTYTNTGSIYVGFANSSNNIRAGTAGQIPYQTGANATSFVGPGTAGQILVSAGTSAPTYTSTGSIYVNRAVLADTAGALTTTNNYRMNSLGVGTDASGTAGEIRATNEITAYFSDRRLKENVKPIDNALTKTLSLHGVTYTPNDLAASFGYDKNKKLVGLFADEVAAVLPEAVRSAPFDLDENDQSKSGDNYKTVQYEKIVPLLVEAIKEQQKLIEKLEKEISEIKKLL